MEICAAFSRRRQPLLCFLGNGNVLAARRDVGFIRAHDLFYLLPTQSFQRNLLEGLALQQPLAIVTFHRLFKSLAVELS